MMLECILKQSASFPDSVMVSVQLRSVHDIKQLCVCDCISEGQF